MVMVAQGLIQKPIPIVHKASHCGVLNLFPGNFQFAGSLSIALLSTILFRRARRD